MRAGESLCENVTLRIAVPHVAVVTISRPEARNAVNVAVTNGIANALENLEGNDEIWVVVLTGAGGKAFSAGADLKEIAAGRALSLRTERGGFAGFVHYPRRKPWIAAVDGFAVGGGFEIALACDMIVATPESVFGLPEPKRGQISAAGGAYRLPRLLPRNIALELITTGGELAAARAHQFGLVNRLAPRGQAVETALELAELICQCAPVAVRESLGLARASADHDDAALRTLTTEAMKRNWESEDYKEGPRAFLEKRIPKWVGR
jgi:enoyl-CoA hydratase